MFLQAVWKYMQIILHNTQPIQLSQRFTLLTTVQLSGKDTTRSTWLRLTLQHAAFNMSVLHTTKSIWPSLVPYTSAIIYENASTV